MAKPFHSDEFSSTSRGFGSFQVTLVLPDGSTRVTCEYPSKYTVEQLKVRAFAQIPELFTLSSNEFDLCVSGNPPLLEEDRFVQADDAITTCFINRAPVEIMIVPHGGASGSTRSKALTSAAFRNPIAGARAARKRTTSNASRPKKSAPMHITPPARSDDPGGFSASSAFSASPPSSLSHAMSAQHHIGSSAQSSTATATTTRDGYNKKASMMQRSSSRPSVTSMRSPNIVRAGTRVLRRKSERNPSAMNASVAAAGSAQSPSSTAVASAQASASAPAGEGSTAIIQGYLIKQGTIRKSWKRRWCVLCDRFIRYFKVQGDATPMGVIDLEEAFCVAEEPSAAKKHCLAVYTEDRTWLLAAETSTEMHRWITSAKRAILSLRKGAELHSSAVASSSSAAAVTTMSGAASSSINADGGGGPSAYRPDSEAPEDVQDWLWTTKAHRGVYRGPEAKWSKLYAVLSMGEGMLSFYPSKPSTATSSAAPSEVVSLERYSSIDHLQLRPHSFSLSSADDTVLLACESDERVAEWTAALSLSISLQKRKNLAAMSSSVDSDICWDGREVVVRKRTLPRSDALESDKYAARSLRQLCPIISQLEGDSEAQEFRKTMMRGARASRKHDKLLVNFILPVRVESAPLPVPPECQKTSIAFHFIPPSSPDVVHSGAAGEAAAATATTASVTSPGDTPQLSIACSLSDTMHNVIEAVLVKHARIFKNAAPRKPEDFVPQVRGRNEYILAQAMSVPLAQITFVHQSVFRGTKLEVVLVPKVSFAMRIRALVALESPSSATTMAGASHPSPGGGPSGGTGAGGAGAEDGVARLAEQQEVVREKCFNIGTLGDVELSLKVLSVAKRSDGSSLVEYNISQLENDVAAGGEMSLSVEALLYYGRHQFGEYYCTPRSRKANWNVAKAMKSGVSLRDLPREARACFRLLAHSSSGGKKCALGWANVNLFDHRGNLLTGVQRIALWPKDRPSPLAPCVPNWHRDALVLSVEFLRPPDGVLVTYTYPHLHGPSSASSSSTTATYHDALGELPRVERLLLTDPLFTLSEDQKRLIWKHRLWIKEHRPQHLAKVLMSVRWLSRDQVAQAHRLLVGWPRVDPVTALELLDSKFPDAWVRTFARKCLEQLTDHGLGELLPQLVQACKMEPYHDNTLARFLLERAFQSRLIVGHALFWNLWTISSQTSTDVTEEVRYALMLEAYFHGCGKVRRKELLSQVHLVQELRRLADVLKKTGKSSRNGVLRRALAKIAVPRDGLTLPLDPRLRISGFLVDECRALDSFTVPMWLVCRNALPLGNRVAVIFKAGDDLRQDSLTLQMIGIMDRLWKEAGMNMRLTTYGCMSTGPDMGFIEVVPHSKTQAEIQKSDKGVAGAAMVFSQRTIADWLDGNTPRELKCSAVENFIWSCAGYCVATYVLGIGDRHNDNVMLTTSGHIFHIDFGHFLGNVLKFGPINRDKAPFVLTPEMAFVMGGKDSDTFQNFIDLCCQAFNILRTNGNSFINFFALMVSTGMPQLSCLDDIGYISRALGLERNESDEEARKRFTDLIYQSLATKTTQWNWAIHILAHPS